MEFLSYPLVKGLIGFCIGYCVGYFILNKILYPLLDRYRNEQEKRISEKETRRMAEEERFDSKSD